MAACPFCAEEVEPRAAKCAHCGEALGRPAAPPKPKSHVALALGLSVLVLGLLCVVPAVVIPNLVGSPRRGNGPAAIGALKTISTAQTLFREGDKENDGVLDYGTLQELSDTLLIDQVLGAGQKQGYVFQVHVSPSTPEFLWMATADPTIPGTTGDRYFMVNQAGVIYYSTTAPFVSTPDCQAPPGALQIGR